MADTALAPGDVMRKPRPGPDARRQEMAKPGRPRAGADIVGGDGDPAVARATVRLGCLLVVAFFVWSALTPLHELTISQGTILPEGFVQDVEHLEGGIVSAILVDDGQNVRKGDTLVRLDDLSKRAELAKAEARLESLELTAERLMAYVEERPARIDGNTDASGIERSQRAVNNSRSALRDAQLAVIAAEIETRKAGIDGALSQIAILEQEATMVAERVSDYQRALKRGAISRREYDAIVRDKLKIDGDIARLSGQLAGSRSALLESNARRREILSQLASDALDELAEVETALAEARALVRQLRDQLGRTVIVSPVDGTVQSLSVRGSGEIIGPGEIVARVVPVRDSVFAQVEIAAEHIGYVEAGMPATVKITAYDAARFGGVDGIVDQVSPGNERTDDGRYVFNARIRLLTNHVGPEENGRVVRPGMTVVSEIKSGEKSVLTFLLKPLRALSDRALIER